MRPPPFLQWMESVTRLLRGRADPSPAEPTWGPSYLILPGPARPPYHGPFSDCARWLLQRATLLAEATCGPTHFLTADPRSGDVRSFPDGTNRRLASLFEGQRHILMLNLSFLLRPPALLPRLRRAAEEGQLALLISPDGRTLEAAAAAQRHARRAEWRRAVAQLASTQVPSDEAHLRGRAMVLLGSGWGEEGGPPSPVGPPALNMALGELLYAPVDAPTGQNFPEHMHQALLAHRDRSAVPWLFNALVNDLESRTGRAVLDSFPPEVHLSLTGRCNIECRFCSYAHSRAYSDYVTPQQVARLEFLRHAHTLRLSSGLGDPTVNPHLADIIHHLAHTHPHLAINFFTNGIALQHRGLIEALVGRAAWINVSLNAATRETWEELCQRDLFERVTDGLKALLQARQRQGTRLPLVYGSMVLTRRNLHELPRMPALCRALGVDRFTAIPFFSYDFDRLGEGLRYGAEDSFHLCRDRYDELFFQTVAEARRYAVSVELPLPTDLKKASFGLEVRSFYNFADLHDMPYYWLPALLEGLTPAAPTKPCHEIYYKAHLGSRQRSHVNTAATHHLYPCLGPMSMVDFSDWTAFDFADAANFQQLWNHPALVRLRKAQHQAGVCPVCDVCRGMDSRDPANFARLEKLLAAERPAPPAFIPVEQVQRRAAG